MRTVRVTEVLDYFKQPWYVKWVLRIGLREANKKSKAALKLGTRIDEMVKLGQEPSKKDKVEVHSAYKALNKWRATYCADVQEPLSLTPCTRINKECCGILLSGEPDVIALGRLTDIKAAKRISKTYWLQLAAYAWLTDWAEEVAVLRLDKEIESFEYVTKRLADEWLIYQGLLRAYVYYTEGDEDYDDSVDV